MRWLVSSGRVINALMEVFFLKLRQFKHVIIVRIILGELIVLCFNNILELNNPQGVFSSKYFKLYKVILSMCTFKMHPQSGIYPLKMFVYHSMLPCSEESSRPTYTPRHIHLNSCAFAVSLWC